MVSRIVDSINKIYNGDRNYINIPQSPGLSNDMNSNLDLSNTGEKKKDSSQFVYKKLDTGKTKKKEIKVTRTSNNKENHQLRKLTKNEDNNIEFNFINIINNNYPYVFNSFKIFREFYF